MATERKNKGRQKIQMTKMSKESNLLVTFSKRRAGLFKKASEICTLCGAEVAIIVFSPGKKVFSFGHPSVETVMDCFLTRNPMMSNSGGANCLLEAHRNANVQSLNVQLTEVLGDLGAEKRRGDMLNQMRKFASQQTKYGWEGPIEELDLDQLEQYKNALEDLEKKCKKAKDKLVIEGSSSNPFLGVNPSAAHGLGLDSHGQDHWYNSTNGQHFGYGGRGFL